MTADRQQDHAEHVSQEPLSMSRQIEAAMQKAVRQALRRHKLVGESIAVSRDGKVVIVPPEEIPDYPEE